MEPINVEDASMKGLALSSRAMAHIFEYRGEQVAGFEVSPSRQLVCLPQLYLLFLKDFVGGLHTVYTKLKRLGIQAPICNLEQVRALRSLGAIQPGVNRCKLIDTADFDVLYEDCTNTKFRPGRPSKRVSSENLEEIEQETKNDGMPSSPTGNNPPINPASDGRILTSPSSNCLLDSFSSIFPNRSANIWGQLPNLAINTSQQALASALAQQLATNNYPQFLLHQFVLHHMATAAAKIVTEMQQRKRGGEEGHEVDNWDRGRSMDTLNGEESNGQHSSGASSRSTTMHGDLVAEKEKELNEASGGPSMNRLEANEIGPKVLTARGKELEDGNRGGRNSSDGRLLMDSSTTTDGASLSSSGNSSSSGSSRSGGPNNLGEVQMALEKLTSVADRVERALKGQCEQLNDFVTSIRSELELAKESEWKAMRQNKLERRKSEILLQKYSRLRRQFHSRASASADVRRRRLGGKGQNGE